MSLPMSKLVCGIGDAPVTGAWIPMTISVSVTPAVSFGPGSWLPTGGGTVVSAAVVSTDGGVVSVESVGSVPLGWLPCGSVESPGAALESVPGWVVSPPVAAVVTGAAVIGAAVAGAAVCAGATVSEPATPVFWPHAADTTAMSTNNGN